MFISLGYRTFILSVFQYEFNKQTKENV